MNIDLCIKTQKDLIDAVGLIGFLPLFRNSVRGFSVEEHVDPSAWFSSEEGVWEWKGPVIREAGCAYGKFFENKAVFVSREWFPDLANYRRDGYDFDARVDDELVPFRDQELYGMLDAPMLSKELKRRWGDRKGFDTIICRLQKQCYVVISDFVYETDKHGRPYGWGVAEYSTPEMAFGGGFCAYERKPSESCERIVEHLRSFGVDLSGKI